MASPISFGGLASGLDTKAIVAALVAVEGRKVERLQFDKVGYQNKISAYDTLLTKLKKLEELTLKLSDRDTFVGHETTLSDGADTFMKATPSGSAAVGTYQLQITAIAESSFHRSDGFVDANQSQGLTGTFSIQVGTTTTDVTIDGTNDSLNGMRDAINDQVDGVTATVVFDGTDYHLELRGSETGVANSVTVLSEPQGGSGPVLNVTEIRAASDAAFTIDGQAFTSSENKVDDAIAGVTLQLLDEQAVGAPPIQLTIAEDFDGVSGQLQEFVDAYNDVVKFLNEQATPRASEEDALKPLAGESALRSIRNDFSSIVSGAANVSSDYLSLSSLGIKSTSDGTLAIDSSKLADALGNDLDGIINLFTDATEGIGAKLLVEVEQRTDPLTGIVDLRKDAFEETIADLDDRIRRAEDSLDIYEESLVKKFAQYETLIGNLQSQGASIGTIPNFFAR